MIKSARPRSWHSKASKFVTWWLIALVIAGLIHPVLPQFRWVLIHLFTLGALTNSVMLWSGHFTEKWLHSAVPDSQRKHTVWRFYLLNSAIMAIILGQLSGIPVVTAIGAGGVILALIWHFAFLLSIYQSGKRFSHSAQAYLLSALSLIVGAAFGGAMAFSLPAPWPSRLLESHLLLNFGGFIGFAALGSLAVLFPAMWRTQIVRDYTKPALYFLATGLVIGIIGSLTGRGAQPGLLIYAAGWTLALTGFLFSAYRVLLNPRDRLSFAALSALFSQFWLIGSLLVFAFGSTLPTLGLLVGFAAQLLIGTMSYVLPSTIGGGPAAVRAGMYTMNQGALFRSTVINGGLLIWIYSTNSWLKVVASLLVCGALGWFLVAMPFAVEAQKAVLLKESEGPEPHKAPRWNQITAGVATLTALAVLFGGGTSVPRSPTSDSATMATGQTTTVDIMIHGMAFSPNAIDVPKGNRLILNVANHDGQIHDLVLESGATSGRLQPGATTTVDAGIISTTQEAWCSIAGHRMQGMTLQINVDGNADHNNPGGSSAGFAKQQPKAPESALVDASLQPAPTAKVHEVTIDVQETEINGRGRWTFNGGVQGPVLRGKVGDEFRVTFINSGTMAHSIDFHAGQVSPDETMKSINPGEQLEYNFRANHAGIWLYHCGTMPMSMHVAAGMFGAVIIDPPGLAPVDHEFLLVQSEVYGLEGTSDNPVDPAKLAAGEPDAVVFNGWEDQYVASPLHMKAGETARFWLLDAGPNRPLSFHIVGGQFHTMYKEGAYTLLDGTTPGLAGPKTGGGQALDLSAAQGGFVEATFPEAGTYTMVNHSFIDAERGARGKLVVTP